MSVGALKSSLLGTPTSSAPHSSKTTAIFGTPKHKEAE